MRKRESGFSGNRFAPLQIQGTPQPKASWTVFLPLVGCNSGPKYCTTCQSPASQDVCSCGTETVFYRQVLLAEAEERGLGVIKLSPEPENPFDSKAVAVLLRFPGNVFLQVGYLPKNHPVTPAHVVFEMLASGTPLFATGAVTGGPKTGTNLYGMRIKITDTPG